MKIWPILSLVIILSTIACKIAGVDNGGDNDDDDNSDTEAGGDDELASTRQKCVDRINEYRASLDLHPYERWTEKETCADGQARSDSTSSIPHSAFGSCGEVAQNECPDFPSLDWTVNECLQMMWDEGPGKDFGKHGHYLSMSNPNYSRVACGFYVTDSDKVWAVQNFI